MGKKKEGKKSFGVSSLITKDSGRRGDKRWFLIFCTMGLCKGGEKKRSEYSTFKKGREYTHSFIPRFDEGKWKRGKWAFILNAKEGGPGELICPFPTCLSPSPKGQKKKKKKKKRHKRAQQGGERGG